MWGRIRINLSKEERPHYCFSKCICEFYLVLIHYLLCIVSSVLLDKTWRYHHNLCLWMLNREARRRQQLQGWFGHLAFQKKKQPKLYCKAFIPSASKDRTVVKEQKGEQGVWSCRAVPICHLVAQARAVYLLYF